MLTLNEITRGVDIKNALERILTNAENPLNIRVAIDGAPAIKFPEIKYPELKKKNACLCDSSQFSAQHTSVNHCTL